MSYSSRLFLELRESDLINQIEQDYARTEDFTPKPFKKVSHYEVFHTMLNQVIYSFDTQIKALKQIDAVKIQYAENDARRNWLAVRPVFFKNTEGVHA
jgi:hypothetical protein